MLIIPKTTKTAQRLEPEGGQRRFRKYQHSADQRSHCFVADAVVACAFNR